VPSIVDLPEIKAECGTMHNTYDAGEVLASFLEKCSNEARNLEQGSSPFAARTNCDKCGASRSMYCFDCCRLLIPFEQRPDPILSETLRLPFDVDLILDDRRASSTGVQMKAIMDSMSQCEGKMRLFDKELNEEVPDYLTAEDCEGTYVLFPCPESIPLSEVVLENSEYLRIRRLVVLDCKWSRSSIRLDPKIAALPRVHLAADRVPKHSYYWRWHSAGQGMLSTAEAIYFSACEVATVDPSWEVVDCRKLVYWMWLFGLQREIIAQRHSKKGKVRDGKDPNENAVLPFDEDAKSASRALRQLHKDRKIKLKYRNPENH